MEEIIVKKQSDNYIAYFKDQPEQWESGGTAYGALGNLVLSFKERLNIKDIKFDIK